MIANQKLINAATATGAGLTIKSPRNGVGHPYTNQGAVLFHSSITGTGAVSATVDIYGSIDGTTATGEKLQTHYLTGTTNDIVADSIAAPWPYFYADVAAISGTDAAVTVSMVG